MSLPPPPPPLYPPWSAECRALDCRALFTAHPLPLPHVRMYARTHASTHPPIPPSLYRAWQLFPDSNDIIFECIV